MLVFFIKQKHTKQYKNWWRGTKLQNYTIYIDEEEQKKIKKHLKNKAI